MKVDAANSKWQNFEQKSAVHQGSPFEVISENHWAAVTNIQLSTWERITSFWQSWLPEIKIHCFRRWLSEEGKYQVYSQVAEKALEKNRGLKGVVTDDDIKSFNRALNTAKVSERPQVCFKLAQAYALRHLTQERFLDSIQKKNLRVLNEKVHNMQMAAISITEVIETLFTELGHTIKDTDQYLNQREDQYTTQLEKFSLQEIQREMSTLRRLVKQGWSDEDRWVGRTEREFEAASKVVAQIKELEKMGKLPAVLKEFMEQFRFILPTYFLRASCYERIGTILSVVYESDDALWTHRPIRWLVKADTAESFFVKAYRDYIISKAMFSIVPSNVRVDLDGNGGAKTVVIIEEAMRRVMKLIADNPKLTSQGKKILSTYGAKPEEVKRASLPLEESVEPIPPQSLSDRRVLHQHLAQFQRPLNEEQRRNQVRQLVNAATYHIERDNTLPAIDLYEKLVMLEPDNIGFLHQLAKLHAGVEHRKRAIAAYEKLLAKDPNNPEFHKELGGLYFRVGNFDQALVFLTRVERLFPKDTEVAKLLGDSYIALQDYAEGVRYYEKAMSLDPSADYAKRVLFDACVVAGDYYYREKSSKTAMKYYQRAYELLGNEYGDYLNRYLELLLQEQMEGKACILYEQLVKKFPYSTIDFDPGAYNIMGDRYVAAKSLEEAAGAYSKTLELKPDNKYAQQRLSYVYHVMGVDAWNGGNKDEAIVYLHRATANNLLATAACHMQLAQFLMQRADDRHDKGTKYDYEVAIIHLNYAVQLSPNREDYVKALAEAKAKVGR